MLFYESIGLVLNIVGALTIEVIRLKLCEKGFNVSHRNVFIEGVPYELDLLVLKENVPNDRVVG